MAKKKTEAASSDLTKEYQDTFIALKSEKDNKKRIALVDKLKKLRPEIIAAHKERVKNAEAAKNKTK